MLISALKYSIHILDEDNKKGYHTEVQIPVTLPQDYDLVKNPQTLFNQVKQDFLITNPDFNRPNVRIIVVHTGDMVTQESKKMTQKEYDTWYENFKNFKK